MKILLATAELSPWAHEGATGNTAAGLARGLEAAGTDVVVAVPHYPAFAGVKGLVRKKRRTLRVPAADAAWRAAWTDAELDGLRLALLEKPEFFDRAGIYGTGDAPYDDNIARFVFFARAVWQMAGALGADVVHGLDWPGALVAALAKRGDAPATLGVDGLRFQGDFPAGQFPMTGLGWDGFPTFEFYGRGNALKAGMLTAAAVVFPGARMAHLAQSPSAGCGLEGVAATAAPRLHGILAGADYGGWLDARGGDARPRKEAARKEWLAAMGLEPLDADGLLVIAPLAMCGGRGLDLLLPVLDRVMEFPVRLAVLGRPPQALAPALQLMTMRHAGRFAVHEPDDLPAVQAAAAAADAMLLPDALAPADLTLPCAMRAGVVPLVQACSGLHEIVQDHDPAGHPGTGLVFYRHDPEGLWDNFVRAMSLRRSGGWDALAGRVAAADFSWDAAAVRYGHLFRSLARPTRRGAK